MCRSSCNSNNTALLESRFEWDGIGFEIKEHEAQMYNDHRRAKVAVGDATTADFDELFNEVELGPTFDLLQVDCEPAAVTFEALKKIDLDKYKLLPSPLSMTVTMMVLKFGMLLVSILSPMVMFLLLTIFPLMISIPLKIGGAPILFLLY